MVAMLFMNLNDNKVAEFQSVHIIQIVVLSGPDV